MTALRMRLQKEVFDPTDEQLVGLARVTRQEKEKKKKKDWLLALTATKDVPVYAKLYLLKQTIEKERDLYKKKQEWQLRDLRILDGLTADSLDIRLDLEERYTWTCSTLQEKESFLKVCQQMCDKYNIGRRTKYFNLSWIAGSGDQSARQRGGAGQDLPDDDSAGYQAISEKETADLRALMSGCDAAVTAADEFADRLARELSILDGDNIHSMMASEEAVDSLMELLTTSIKEVEHLESRLNQYDDLLEHIRDSMEKMEGKTESLEMVNENNGRLLNELDSLVSKLQISYEHQVILQEADFANNDHLPETIEAAQALSNALLAPIPFSLTKMAAVQEQRKRCERWKEKFSKNLCRHLNNVFVHLGNEPGENLAHNSTKLSLPARHSSHKELLHFADLMHWLKQMEPKSYHQLQRTYTASLAKLYERDLTRFLEDAYLRVGGTAAAAAAATAASTEQLLNAGSSSKRTPKASTAGLVGGSGITQLLGSDKETWGSENSITDRERFDDTLERLLGCLRPVVMAEQTFCVAFFRMDSKLSAAGGGDPAAAAKSAASKTKAQKQVTEEVRKMMSTIFASMEVELVKFLAHFERVDSFNSMYSYVRLSSHVLQAQDTGSFLAITLGSALIHTKRNFDRLMQVQLRSIEDCKPPRRQRCGILAFVSNLGEFLSTTELVFRNSDRRGDIEKWYMTIITSIMDNIPRIAKEHQKTPQEVVKMENFHHLVAELSSLKIPVLDQFRRDAKQKYTDALHNYVTQYFGRPLEKVNQFFDGVSARIGAGVKEAEISYQLQFSKQELRKVLAAYPGKEVKKGLTDLYKKVEKHLSEEENLLQVVWHAMQEEFIRQYKYIEDLLQRCYPGSQIALDFAITDILDYFSDIARLH